MERLSELWTHSPVMLSGIVLGLSSIGYVVLKTRSDNPPKGLVYPDGPPRYPIIGSLLSLPKEDIYGTSLKWQKEYGDIVYLPLPGVSMIFLNSLDMAQELLSKRGNNTSARTNPYMAGELLGWNWALVIRQADSTHQLIRKMLRRGIGPQRVASHDPLVERTTNQLLVDLKGFHGNPKRLVFDAIGHIIIELTYGAEIWNQHSSELTSLNLEALNILNSTLGKLYLVDVFNFLRFIPSWMPGAEFRRLGIHSTKLATRIRNWPFQLSKESKRLGHSLIADLFAEYGQTDIVRDAVGILYTLGADTTTSTVIHFLHCMFMFPEIATKIQTEIDAIIDDRLPEIDDREYLPYTEAAWKESLRWNATLPLGVPHTNIQDEVIDGFFIPKGSIINPNIGFMLMDPKIWRDPDVFRPERHLEDHDPPLPNPASLVFGFGLRLCPGKDIASRAGFYIATTIMSIYNILPLEGKSAPDPYTVKYNTDFLRFPEEFDCRFVPRGEKAIDILSSLAVH